MPLELLVNGSVVVIASDAETPLLYVLRDELGLTGTRYGCGAGWCGACVILADGRPVTSCDTPASAVAGCSIRTIEGLAGRDGLDPVQRALLDEQAGQCGYCLSGIILAARAMLDVEPSPTESAVRAALDGHLCRCGAQVRMIRAVMRAAAAGSADAVLHGSDAAAQQARDASP